MNQTSFEQLSGVARSFIVQKKWHQLAQVAMEIQRSYPSSPEGFFLMGVYSKHARDIDSAERLFGQALSLDSLRYDAAIELALVLEMKQQYTKLLSLVDEFEEQLKNSAYYSLELSRLFARLGLHERALVLAKRAQFIQSDNDIIAANLAECSVFLGEVDAARDIYEKLVRKYPHYQKNHYELSKLRKASDYSHVTIIKELLTNNGLPPAKNIYLYYALAKQLEDLEDWDEAFHYYEKAGAEILNSSNYSVTSDIEVMENVVALFDNASEFEHIIDHDTSFGPTPIFVVGLPRTGSTLIERVLSSHPNVESADETFFFPMALNKEVLGKYFAQITIDTVSSNTNKDLDALAKGYLDLIDYKLSGKPYFIDKYPFNFILLGFIAKAFPNAKFIYLDRHPLDACFAMFKQSYFKFAYCLEDVGRYYIAHRKLKNHWFDLLGERIINVSYESFVSCQRDETAKLLSSLGLNFDEKCINYHLNPKASGTASTLQVREQVHNRSVGRWEKYKKHLKPLESMLNEHNLL